MPVKNATSRLWSVQPSADGRRWSAWPAGDKPGGLAVHASGRYLTSAGSPIILIGDSPWMIAQQLTNTQIDSYLNDRSGKGCNCILIEAGGAKPSSQTPEYRNADGVDPYTVMSPVSWVMNGTYWNRVDYIVNGCLSRGMIAIINPAYWGFGDGSDGWATEIAAAGDATLQAYGAALANRYTQGNVIWCMGGDFVPSSVNRTKQWQIITGIRSVRTTDLVTAHSARYPVAPNGVDGEAYLSWGSGYAGFSLNNIYCRDDGDEGAPTLSASAYGRAGPMPFFMIEAGYEGTAGTMAGSDIVPTIRGILGGGLAGGLAGHDALWHFGSLSPDTLGPAATLSNYLANSWTEFGFLKTLLTAYSWWLLQPKTDATLVTTSLGTGASTISPARASDGSFAMIHTPSGGFTVAMSQLSPASVRARWWNWSDGTFTAAAGSPFANTGTQAFTPPGDRILVLDAAP